MFLYSKPTNSHCIMTIIPIFPLLKSHQSIVPTSYSELYFIENIDATSKYFTPCPVVRSKYTCMSYCAPIFSFYLECFLELEVSPSLKDWDPLLSGFFKNSTPLITIFLHYQLLYHCRAMLRVNFFQMSYQNI